MYLTWVTRSSHYLLFYSCTCSKNQPSHSFRKTLTIQEGVTSLVCVRAPTVLEGSHGKVMKCCRAAEPRWEPFKGFAWYFWIVCLSLLSFLPVWGKRRKQGEQLVLNWSSGERLVSATPPAVWAALQLQSILPYKFTTDSQWQVLARYTSAVLCVAGACARE